MARKANGKEKRVRRLEDYFGVADPARELMLRSQYLDLMAVDTLADAIGKGNVGLAERYLLKRGKAGSGVESENPNGGGDGLLLEVSDRRGAEEMLAALERAGQAPVLDDEMHKDSR